MMALVWNPNKVAFKIPYWGFEVLWYGVLFALGVFLATLLFSFLLRRFLLTRTSFTTYQAKNLSISDLNEELSDDEYFEKTSECALDHFAKKHLSDLQRSRLHNRRRIESKYKDKVLSLFQVGYQYTDRLLLSVIGATVIGARLGHILFYTKITPYIQDPLRILNVREGGLTSHGAAIAILLTLLLFARLTRRWVASMDFLCLLDLTVVPVAFAGGFIRIGNFFNQEFVGKPTDLPWGITFLNPAEPVSIVARHPVQLYESLAYFSVGCLLVYCFHRFYGKLRRGVLSAGFFIGVFGLRFLIEFLKVIDSPHVASTSTLNMPQWLNLPLIALGVLLIFIEHKRLNEEYH